MGYAREGRPVESGIATVEGDGERSAKGSSSSRSEGGEFLGVKSLGRVVGKGGMGIAGGKANSEMAAVAEWERNLMFGEGGEARMTPSEDTAE